MVTTKVAYLAIGVDVEGRKHALGCWIQDTEGAKFWQKVVIDLRNRGVNDILIACCDGLTGLPDAIRSVFPETVVQTCVVHVIRNAMRFVSYNDRKKVAAAMREIYTAPTVDGAELALAEFDRKFGEQYPGAIDTWRLVWGEFIPFLDYPVELRQITKNRGHFPDKDAAMKLLTPVCATSPAREEVNRGPEHKGGRSRSTPCRDSSLADFRCARMEFVVVLSRTCTKS